MEPMYYIGLDVHKRKISYCMKDSSSAEGSPPATRMDLDHCGVDRNLAPTEPLSLPGPLLDSFPRSAAAAGPIVALGAGFSFGVVQGTAGQYIHIKYTIVINLLDAF